MTHRKKILYILPLFAILLFHCFNGVSQIKHHHIKFDEISLKDGLSQSSINSIIQDEKGFMWFGTLDGLNKYDGYKITEYRHSLDDSKSLSDNAINVLFEDSEGIIWIGTKSGGLNRFNKISNSFTSYQHNPHEENSLSSNNITAINEDHKGYLWIGTDRGLNRYNRKTGKIKIYTHHPKNRKTLSNNTINQIVYSKSGDLWIATNNGLNRYDATNNEFLSYRNIADTVELENPDQVANKIRAIHIDKKGVLWLGTNNGLTKMNRSMRQFITYIHNPDDEYSLSDNSINSIVEDTSGVLWIGTERGGLNAFYKDEEIFIRYTHDPADTRSISSNNILTLYQDKAGILWIGTSLGGVNKWNRAAENLNVFRHNPYDPYSLSSNQVRTIYQDKSSEIWIGTVDGGLNKWNKSETKFIHYKHEPKKPQSISYNHIRSILEDSQGNFWIGTDGGGLNKFDTLTGTFTRYKHNEKRPNSISSNRIWKLYEDSNNNLWIATYGGGLNLFDHKKNSFKSYQYDPNDFNSISNNNVTTLLEDQKGRLWIGTFGGGLNKFDIKQEKFVRYKHNDNNPKSLGNNRIYSLLEDSDGILWIGLKGCLNRFNEKDQSFTRYDERDGLPNNVIMGILEDNQGYLWISTNNGLSKFDKKNRVFRNYDARDGLQSNEFLVGSYCKAKDGEMFFGGINGFNAFYPQTIKDNPHVPEIVITGFQVFNKEVKLDSSITEKKIITLPHDQNFVSFDFVALDYIFPEKNQYAYKLIGYDKDWNKVKNRRFATYTNLPPKKYFFKVIGSNNDGVWNQKGVTIILEITPAFYQTLWFKITMVFIALITAFIAYRLRVRSIEARNNQLEALVKVRTAEIIKQKEEIEAKRDAIEEQRDEIEAQRDELQKQRDLANHQRDQIAEQKKEITDSIIYAKRIQNATLPTDFHAEEFIQEAFVLFKPKDIVSGDFYWVGRSGNNKLVVIAADCTGHGVPGAFMSMLGISFLNKIVNEKGISKPHSILNRLRENVIRSLHQKGSENEAKDGMDIALCTIDRTKMKLEFAGANNPLYLIRNNEAFITKGDKMPIAIFDDMSSFSTNEIDIQIGDAVYIFSDGFADQFGGPRGKKFKYKPFRELLISISQKPMSEQKEILNQTITDWMGDKYEQVDDILVIGFRI